MKVFGTLSPDVSSEKDPNWWRYHSHLTYKNKQYTYRHLIYFSCVLSIYILSEYWMCQKFRFRNDWFLWEFYRYDEQMYMRYQDQLQDAATNYKERRWYEDSYARLESGGNLLVIDMKMYIEEDENKN